MLNIKQIKINFQQINNWEERYIYLIELGKKLKIMPKIFYKKENLIPGCQSYVWIKLIKLKNNKVKFFGDSDSDIVKGLIAIVFFAYHNMQKEKILSFNIHNLLEEISLKKYLTFSRSQGLLSIISFIKKNIKENM